MVKLAAPVMVDSELDEVVSPEKQLKKETLIKKFVDARNAYFNVLGFQLTEEWQHELEIGEKDWTRAWNTVEARLEHLVKEGMIEPLSQKQEGKK